MYTVELTQGAAWDAPVIEAHSIKTTIHIVDIERRAQALLNSARQTDNRYRPTNYRILDPLGRCVRSSATAATPRSFLRQVGRTSWA